MGYCCPPGSGYGSTDLTESGSNPDPKHCFFELVSDAARGPVRTFSHAAAAAQEPAHLAQGADHQQEEDVQVVTHPSPSPFLHSVQFSRQQCCGSGMFIPDSDFIHPGSRIADPGSKNGFKREG